MKWSIPSLMVAGAATPLLLNKYPGATVAYSTRKINSAAVYAIRVRRSSDDAEQDIGFSGIDLDTAALTSFVGANDGFVKTCYDQSGNGNNATQTTNASQPKIVESGVIVRQGSRPYVRFSGSQILTLTSGIDSTVGYTIFYSEYKAASTDLMAALGMSSGNMCIALHSSDGYVYVGSNTASVYHQWIVSGKRLVTGFFDGASSVLAWGNGSALGAFGSIPTSPGNIDLLGAYTSSFYSTGYLSEIILYLTDQTSNRTYIEGDMNGYFNIF